MRSLKLPVAVLAASLTIPASAWSATRLAETFFEQNVLDPAPGVRGSVGRSSVSGPRQAFGTFDIDLRFEDPVSSTVEAAFDSAEAFWESRILGYESQALAESYANLPSFDTASLPAPPSGFDYGGPLAAGVTILARIAPDDGVGGVLGFAGSFLQFTVGGVATSVAGVMSFDSADLDDLATGGTLDDVIRHEMAHALGFLPNFWNQVGATDNEFDAEGDITSGDETYTGAFALAAYQHEFDPDATFVPVEAEGGDGTAFAHWDEAAFQAFCDPDVAGDCPTTDGGIPLGNPELMTGFIEGETTFSRTTLASFDDLGYVTTAMQPIPVPLTSVLLLSGLGALGWAGRRRAR